MSLKTIGITTTIPIEILYAAGYKAVDLNNIFVTSPFNSKYIDIAETRGFPKSLCAWIKGLYGAVKENKIDTIVSLQEGDCSNTKALNDILKNDGVKTFDFSYPTSHDFNDLKKEINKFMDLLDVSLGEVEDVRESFNSIRKLAKKVDDLTIEGKVTGFENHITLVSCSDFNSDPVGFKENLKNQIEIFSAREPKKHKLKIGYIGVPPITGDLYSFVEEKGASIIFNEVQREFSFPRESSSIYKQYHDYTYPYSVDFRVKNIVNEIKARELDALIHYTQSFCHKGLEDIIIKDGVDIPVLTIEGDKSTELDARTKLRIETFLDMLMDQKGMAL